MQQELKMPLKTMVGELTASYRRTNFETTIVRNSNTIADFLRPIFEEFQSDHERFYAVYLDRANRIIHYSELSRGDIAGTVVPIKFIMRNALICNANSIILAHNHPSGQMIPSQADRTITNKVVKAGEYMEIKVLDHVIMCGNGHYSFADEGLI